MNRLTIAAIATALGAISSPSHATEFLYSGSIESYLVPTTGYYAFTVAGAQAGSIMNVGGGGALITGKLHLTQGTTLSILAGGFGATTYGDSAAGGGGMSFISLGSIPLIVAGGGGAAWWTPGSFGGDAQIFSPNGFGGIGQGAGAGWYSDGNNGIGPDKYIGGGGHSAPTFAGGDPNTGPSNPDIVEDISIGGRGGFGGGGGGGYSCGGGGGGYSGGSGGCGAPNVVAGGGGSFITPDAVQVTAIAGGNKGPLHEMFPGSSAYYSDPLNGFVEIAVSAVPEPASWVMLIVGFGFTGFLLRRKSPNQALREMVTRQ